MRLLPILVVYNKTNMQRFSALTLSIISTILLLATGCRKDGKDLSEVTFTNQIGETVVLDIYPTLGDYSNNTNPIVKMVVPAYSNLVLKGSTFKPGQNYYMDWYSPNHYYSNWYNDKYKNDISYVTIEPTNGNNTYYMTPTFLGTKQAVFLDTFETKTNWKAVDVYQYSAATGYVSVWNLTSLNDQYKEITINKNFTASYTYKDEYGHLKNEMLDFKVHESKDAYIEFMDATNNSLGSMLAGRIPTGTPPEYRSESVDTVLALLPHSEIYYLMVKQ
jgi:hypothetical protein